MHIHDGRIKKQAKDAFFFVTIGINMYFRIHDKETSHHTPEFHRHIQL